jgi:copper transport protein
MIRWQMSYIWSRLLLLFVFLMFILPTTSSAHSALLQAFPAPNSILQTAPKEIHLDFNERLQKELFSIKVYDDQGTLISKNPTVMSTNQKALTMALPQLKSGVFTVTYHIISADGHAVKSTYVLTLGQPSDPPQPIVKGHNHSDTEAIYSFRIVHYLFLLSLVGFIFWRPFISFGTKEEQQEYQKWLRYVCHFNLFFLVQTLLLQSVDSLDEITYLNIKALWTGTSVGISWICILALSLLAYWAAHQKRWLSSAWITLLMLAQTFSGHAYALDPPIFTLLLDWVHLLAASIWISGLLFISLFMKNHRELILRFLPMFSKGALLSIVALVISGTCYALLLIPQIQYLFYTGWGLFLLAKLCLVIAIIFTGSRIRQYLSQGKIEQLRIWLKRDFALMLGILCIVGIFTYLAPAPINSPLDWRFTQGNDQRNVSITPNLPGNNQFSVYLTQPISKANYKSVSIQLHSYNQPDIAPIEIPLRLLNQSVSSSSAEIQQFTYSAEGPFLAFPGKWRVQLILVDLSDNELIYHKNIRVY